MAAPTIAAGLTLVFGAASAPARPDRCAGSLNVVQHKPVTGAFVFECEFRLQEFTAHSPQDISPQAIGENFSCHSRSRQAFHCEAPTESDGTMTSIPFGRGLWGLLRTRHHVCSRQGLRMRVDAVGVSDIAPLAPRIAGTTVLEARC